MTPRDAPSLIFVVDDVNHNREMYVEYLRFVGYAATGCENGEEAISKAAQLRPALIVMDLTMPVMDGWETTRRLKHDPATKEIPIIVLTAHSLDGARQQAIDAGADVCVSKPYLPEDLVVKIRELLNDGPI